MISRNDPSKDSWTLFLDRDGVINKPKDTYISSIKQFELLQGVEEAFSILAPLFKRIFVVTNQHGIHEKTASNRDIENIHQHLLRKIENAGGRIDKIYYSTAPPGSKSNKRKPGIGMALQARKEFPGIHFKQSIMVGDNINDMVFGKKLKMKTVFIATDYQKCRQHPNLIDYCLGSLYDFANWINSNFIRNDD